MINPYDIDVAYALHRERIARIQKQEMSARYYNGWHVANEFLTTYRATKIRIGNSIIWLGEKLIRLGNAMQRMEQPTAVTT